MFHPAERLRPLRPHQGTSIMASKNSKKNEEKKNIHAAD